MHFAGGGGRGSGARSASTPSATVQPPPLLSLAWRGGASRLPRHRGHASRGSWRPRATRGDWLRWLLLGLRCRRPDRRLRMRASWRHRCKLAHSLPYFFGL